MIAEAVNYIKNIFQNDFSGHDYFHSLQVYRVARAIAEQENADREIVSKIGMVEEEYQGTLPSQSIIFMRSYFC